MHNNRAYVKPESGWRWTSARWATMVVAAGLLACRWFPVGSESAESESTTEEDASTSEPEPAPTEPVEPKAGYVTVTVGGVAMTDDGNVVFLVDPTGSSAVPIFIGSAEAFSIQLRLDERRFRRPLTHDLFDAAVNRLGGRVVNVRIDQIKSNTFHATLVVAQGKERYELDARSSDAIAIAVGNGTPIHMAKAVIEESGVDVARLEALTKTREPPARVAPPAEAPIKL
jgi:bifunctional DNase/RNase